MRTMTVLALLAVLAGCGDQAGTRTGSAADPATYVVTGVTEKGATRDLVPGTEIRLRFADGRLTVTAGCNTMSGGYTLDGTRLTVAALAMTEMGCEQARMDQDTWLGGLFARPVQFTPGPDGAVISGDTVLAIADREAVSPDLPLVGTKWLLDTVYDGEVSSSVPAGQVSWVVFDHEGEMRYSDGLNDGGGRFTMSGDKLTFQDVSVTAVGCLRDCPVGDFDVLTRSAAYRIEERRLTLSSATDGLGFHSVDKLPTH